MTQIAMTCRTVRWRENTALATAQIPRAIVIKMAKTALASMAGQTTWIDNPNGHPFAQPGLKLLQMTKETSLKNAAAQHNATFIQFIAGLFSPFADVEAITFFTSATRQKVVNLL